MRIKGVNHFLFSVSDLDKSIDFYQRVFDAKLLVKGKTTAYFDLNGIWLALNEERGIPRNEINQSYTHLAFSVDEREFDDICTYLKGLDIRILPGRKREAQDKGSIYFADPDGHKFEFHTGTLQDRLAYYKKEKPHMKFYDTDNDLIFKRGCTIEVRRWNGDEAAPLDLLLLADPSQAYIEDYLQRGQCFIAEMDNQLIGVFVLLQTRPGTVELANIAVKETEHGKGIGKQLVMYAIQIAKSSGYKSIEVGTGNSSIGQLALYQKCGFRITGIERDYFIRNYNEEIMENNIQCRDMIRLALDLQN